MHSYKKDEEQWRGRKYKARGADITTGTTVMVPALSVPLTTNGANNSSDKDDNNSSKNSDNKSNA